MYESYFGRYLNEVVTHERQKTYGFIALPPAPAGRSTFATFGARTPFSWNVIPRRPAVFSCSLSLALTDIRLRFAGAVYRFAVSQISHRPSSTFTRANVPGVKHPRKRPDTVCNGCNICNCVTKGCANPFHALTLRCVEVSSIHQ